MELENQTDCMRDLEEISAQEKNFTADLVELRSLDPLLEEFMDAEAMCELRERVEAMQQRRIKVKQQLDAYREVLKRCVLVLKWSQIKYIYTPGMHSPNDVYFNYKCSSIVVCILFCFFSVVQLYGPLSKMRRRHWLNRCMTLKARWPWSLQLKLLVSNMQRKNVTDTRWDTVFTHK